MASQGGDAATGSGAKPAEVSGLGQTNPSLYPPLASGHHPWSSSTGDVICWNYSVDNSSQDAIFYDPQRDVSISGGTQTVASNGPHIVQSTMGTTNATHSYVPYANSVQHGYNPAEYASYYYNYPQTADDSFVQQGGSNQHPGAAYQPLTSFQNSGSYAGPASNTYYNAGAHQTAPGYGTSNYYYQNNTWAGGSSGNNNAQLYQSYSSSDTNSVQSSSSAPANSLHYQQQYNQWPYYYNQSVPNGAGNPVVAGSGTSENRAASTSSGYSYPSSQPPPPGTTSWKSDAGPSVAPPMQAPGVPGLQNQYVNQAQGIPGFQNQYVNQAPGVPGFQNHYADQAGVPAFQNHYADQAPACPQNTMNSNHLPLSNHEDHQKMLHSQGPRSNISSVNHVSENFRPTLQGAVTTGTLRESKLQIPTNPQIASGFSMVMPKSEKKILQADLAKKPAYVSVSMPKNDAKPTQDGPEAVMQITTKTTADGSLHTKNWDIESLFPLPVNAVTTAETSTAKNSSPFTLSTSGRNPSRRVKSRWEPVVEEKVPEKVEVVGKRLANDNVHSNLEATDRMASNWDFGKFLQSRIAPISKFSQRPAKKQRVGRNSSLIEKGNASSDSDKEQGLTKYYANAITLAHSPEEKKRREHRSKRFEKSQDSSSKLRNSVPNKDALGKMHTKRGISMLFTRSNENGASLAVEDMDWDALTVKGTCQEIKKRYLRLTSAPDPATVRPEDVLEKALAMVESSQKNYLFKCDQLKSIRQDLTVQRIQNELTVKVYETHARLALQAGDLPEYNQCQSQLKRLYAGGIKGSYFEFSAYNLLCVMLHSNNGRDLLSSMASLSKEAKQDAAVKHALAVHSAVSSGNYVLFFKLYKKAPNLNTCLMDLYVERMRFEALKCMSKSYRPSVPVRYVAWVLGFLRIDMEDCEAKGADGSEECEEWLKAHGAVLAVDNNNGESQIDTKVSSATLYMPEPENAVAHGDASLAVDDFLARGS